MKEAKIFKRLFIILLLINFVFMAFFLCSRFTNKVFAAPKNGNSGRYQGFSLTENSRYDLVILDTSSGNFWGIELYSYGATGHIEEEPLIHGPWGVE
jgi:hypothetical protein